VARARGEVFNLIRFVCSRSVSPFLFSLLYYDRSLLVSGKGYKVLWHKSNTICEQNVKQSNALAHTVLLKHVRASYYPPPPQWQTTYNSVKTKSKLAIEVNRQKLRMSSWTAPPLPPTELLSSNTITKLHLYSYTTLKYTTILKTIV
jgi:hypothetical protein